MPALNKIDLDAPCCPALAEPAVIEADAAFVVLATVPGPDAEQSARAAITGSILRPEDIAQATIGATRLVYVPFWRFEVAVASHQVSIGGSVEVGTFKMPIPVDRHSHQKHELYLPARRLFPFQPNLVERAVAVTGFRKSASSSGWRGLAIRLDEMTPRAAAPALAGEIVAPDVGRAEATAEALKRAVGRASAPNAVYSQATPEVLSAACCHYPLYVTRYTYEGHASTEPGKLFWVLVSGRTGKVVGAEHPSVIRSLARRFRSLLTFGK